jgi:protein required for attachment to host cells
MQKSFIVAAHRGGAFIFESSGPNSKWKLRHHLDHPEGRLRDGEIDEDRPGSVVLDGGGTRAMPTEERPTEHLAVAFAREIAGLLRRERLDRGLERLILVAPPSFLGKLRAALDPQTAVSVVASLAKDLAQPEPSTLRAMLADQVLV